MTIMGPWDPWPQAGRPAAVAGGGRRAPGGRPAADGDGRPALQLNFVAIFPEMQNICFRRSQLKSTQWRARIRCIDWKYGNTWNPDGTHTVNRQ